MTNQELKDKFDELLVKPFPVNISLNAPALLFQIADIQTKDPVIFEDLFKQFLKTTFKEDLNFIFAQNHDQGKVVPAKIKWSLAAFSYVQANQTWTVSITVPLF